MRLYELRAATTIGRWKIRVWKKYGSGPIVDSVVFQGGFERALLELETNLDMAVEKYHTDNISLFADSLLESMYLDAVEICDSGDNGIVVYKEWP